MSAVVAPPAPDPSTPQDTIGQYVRRWWVDVKSGELGSLPIIVGLIVICIRASIE